MRAATAAPTVPMGVDNGRVNAAFADPVRTGPRLVRVPVQPGPVRALPSAPRLLDLDSLTLRCVDGVCRTVADVLRRTDTRALLLVRAGTIVAAYADPPGALEAPHLLMSITKSVVGCVAGVLLARGVLSADDLVTAHVPELARGYPGTTVRHLLDMRTGVDYDERVDGSSRARVLGEVMYLPPASWASPESSRNYLLALASTHAPGGPFAYRSADTDVLGWVLERAARRPLIDLIADLVLGGLGLERDAWMATDAWGDAIASGGLMLAPRDLARFGLMLAAGGAAGAQQVLPVAFLQDTLRGGADSVAAMTAALETRVGPHEAAGSRGFYRNQFWVPERNGTRLLCLGIHGQTLLVDTARDLVAVKLSWWPTPQDPARFTDALAALDRLAEGLDLHPPATSPLAR